MGSYTNGVYVPSIGEVGWGEEVNDFLTQHGKEQINVREAPYGLKGDGTDESSSALAALSTASQNKQVVWPPGTYKFPDGAGLSVLDGAHHIGVFRNTIISVKNAYAFSSTGVTDVRIDGFTIQVRSGATTGGAVKTSGNNNNSWWLQDIYADGQTTMTEPMFELGAIIGAGVVNCTAGGAPVGFRWRPAGWFCNANSMSRCRVVNSTNANTVTSELGTAVNAGILLDSCANVNVRDSIIESCFNGYGIYGHGASHGIIEGNWFEANLKDNIHLKASSYYTVTSNKFQAQGAGDATADHIDLENTAGAGQHESFVLANNRFQDLPTSGVHVRIGSNVEQTTILGGDVPSGSALSDSGTNTLVLGSTSMVLPADIRKLKVRTTRTAAALSSGDINSTEAVFYVADNALNNWFIIGSIGAPVFVTKDKTSITSTESLATNAFVLYWDEAAGQIKARVRKNDGSYTTLTVA